MKTTANFFQNHRYYSKYILLLALLIPWTSCTDDETVPPEPIAIIDYSEEFTGNFQLIEDDCSSANYMIEISRVNPDDYSAPIVDPIRTSGIYISNLANIGRDIVRAEWDGNGFEVRDQQLFVDEGIVRISAWIQRIYPDKLTVYYTMITTVDKTTCSCTFQKVG